MNYVYITARLHLQWKKVNQPKQTLKIVLNTILKSTILKIPSRENNGLQTSNSTFTDTIHFLHLNNHNSPANIDMTRHLPEMMDAESLGKFDGVRSEMLLLLLESAGLRLGDFDLSPFTVIVTRSCQSHSNGHVSHSNGHMIDREEIV